MMRTIEVLIVIIILTGAFFIASFYAVLPWPRQVSPVNLRRMALTTLQTLDSNYDLSKASFDIDNYTVWGDLQVALSASLPPNVLYNLTVFEISGEGTELYTFKKSISNAENLGATSDASSYMVASSNVTFNVIPEKIGEQGGGTLYILNCSDANGWWITGYTAQSLAEDLYKLLSPYFVNTIMVQSTAQLGQVLSGTALQGENIQNAVIINTCGEAVPIPTAYCTAPYSGNSYAYYGYFLGQKVRQYNWTWASIVGYPLYYVSNENAFPTQQNSWGIYGMNAVGAGGLNAFLEGLNNEPYSYSGTWITGDPNDDGRLATVPLTSDSIYYCNYYGIYPFTTQTATRALPSSILTRYNLTATTYIFEPIGTWLAGAIFKHNSGSGSFLALGLTRTPEIRITAVGLLSDFKPRLYRSEYTAYGTSRIVVLQLGLLGGA
jgi:hypothetical protein